MRRLTFLAATVLVAACAGTPVGSVPAGVAESTPVAKGSPSPADLESTPASTPACPTGVLSVDQLSEAPLSCYGHQEVTVRGFLGDPPAMGWEPPAIEPHWLWVPRFEGKVTLWQAGPGGDSVCGDPGCGSGSFVFIYLPPTSHLAGPAGVGWAVVTGHRMDLVAEQCHWVYGADAVPDPTFNNEDARQACRRAFVVTSIEKAVPSAAPTAIPTSAPPASKVPAKSPSPSRAIARCGFPTTILALTGHDPAWPVTSTLILDCLGRSEIRVTGWLAAPWGIGWGSPGVEPAWLGDMLAIWRVLWLKPMVGEGCYEDTDCLWMHLTSPNASSLSLTPDRWVTITGHFDDPAAASCYWTGSTGVYSVPLTKAEAVALCRSHFVVTAIDDANPVGSSPTP